MLAFAPALPDDAVAGPLVAALIAEMAARYGENLNLPYDAARFAPPAGLLVVGSEDGRPVACGGFIRFDETTAELKRMYVVPAARGRGLGRALLAHLERAAAAAGYTRMVLETGDRLTESLGLYRSAGYREIPRYAPYADREISVCMARAIHPPAAART